MRSYFESRLCEALTIVENIAKKLPYIIKQLRSDNIVYNKLYKSAIGYELTHKDTSGTKLANLSKYSHSTTTFYWTSIKSESYDSLTAQMRDDNIPRQERPATFEEYIDETFADYLMDADPVAQNTGGKKTPYINYILKWLLNGSLEFPRDISKIKVHLVKYQKLIHNKGATLPDLDSIDDANQLIQIITDYNDTTAYERLANKKLPDIVPGVETYRLDTWEESEDLLVDSGWCINKEPQFNHYEPPFFVMVRLKGDTRKRLALFNVQTGEFRNIKNEPVQEAEALAPIIDHILSHTRQLQIDVDDLSGIALTDLLPIFHLLTKSLHKLPPHAMVEAIKVAGLTDRLPRSVEERLKTNPESFLEYVECVSERELHPDLEEDLIDLAYMHFDKNLPYIVLLLNYFGENMSLFDYKADSALNNGMRADMSSIWGKSEGHQWTAMRQLLQELVKYDLIDEFREIMNTPTGKAQIPGGPPNVLLSRVGKKAFLALAGSEWFV